MEQFTETYNFIKASTPKNLRSELRKLALTGLVLKDSITGIERYLETPRVQFLYIHHSFKDELVNLDILLKELSRNHTFIPYSEAVNLILSNKIDKPYISISSDDGFKNNLYAAEILHTYDAKACFFINPGLIDEVNFEKIRQHCKNKLHLPPVEFLKWDDVLKLKNQGHEIGGHTMFHDNMAEMTDTDLEKDIQNTYQIIKEKCGESKHFAFPYGRFFHFNEKGRKAVFDNGFISCASAERGCHINGNEKMEYERLCIRRDHIILDWKLSHIMYFMARNVKRKSILNNLFPY